MAASESEVESAIQLLKATLSCPSEEYKLGDYRVLDRVTDVAVNDSSLVFTTWRRRLTQPGVGKLRAWDEKRTTKLEFDKLLAPEIFSATVAVECLPSDGPCISTTIASGGIEFATRVAINTCDADTAENFALAFRAFQNAASFPLLTPAQSSGGFGSSAKDFLSVDKHSPLFSPKLPDR